MSTFDKVKEIVIDKLGVEEDKIVSNASFVDDLGADSLDTVELIMQLEEEFSIEIPDEDAEKMESSIVQNQNYFSYWMNFDTPLDLIPFLMWATSILFIAASFVMMLRDEDEYELEEIEEESNLGLLQRMEQM